MALTEEQLAEAQAELARRAREKSEHYQREYFARMKAAEDAFWERMRAKYPKLDRETMHDIWSEVDDFYR
jgi:hypothetical protein